MPLSPFIGGLFCIFGHQPHCANRSSPKNPASSTIVICFTGKMLSNALKNMGISSVQAAAWLERAGIDPKRRGETLSLADFASLTNCFKEVLAEAEQ